MVANGSKKDLESPTKAARKGSGDSPGKVNGGPSSAACAAATPRSGLTLAPFTEAQVLAITNSIQFEKAIAAQLNSALLDIVPGILLAELPSALEPLLLEQRSSVQAMLDNANSKLDGQFKEALAAAQTNHAAAMAVDGDSPQHGEVLQEVRAVDVKFDDFNARLAKLELAPHPSLNPDSAACASDSPRIRAAVDKAVEEKLAATPRASPSGSLDGASTPGLGSVGGL